MYQRIAIAASLTLAGCHVDAWGDSHRVTEDFRQTHPMAAGSRLTMENFNGSIELYGWDKNEIEINATKYASSPEALAEIKIEVSANAEGVEIRTVRPPMPTRRRGNQGAKYRVHIPSKTRLAMIASSNGPVRVQGVEGGGAIKTSNGPVKIVECKGDLRIGTTNGPVEMTSYSGDADVETTNGPVKIDGATASVNVTSTNGPLTARLTGGKARGAKLRTSNGPVSLTIDGPVEGEVEARTTNGPITLRLPATANGRLRAHTSNSSVTTDFDLKGSVIQKKSEIEGTLGSGGPLIDLNTSNGPIRIQRN